MKRYFALLLALAMMLALAGCQASANKTDSSGASGGSMQSNSSVTPEEIDAADKSTSTGVLEIIPIQPQDTDGVYLLLDAKDAYEGAYCFVAEDTGSYEFEVTDAEGQEDVEWNIYVLDKAFSDGLRFLSQAEVPVAVVGNHSKATFEIVADQFVYCECSRNAWTDDDTTGISALVVRFTAGIVPNSAGSADNRVEKIKVLSLDGADLYEQAGWESFRSDKDGICTVSVANSGEQGVTWSFYVTKEAFEDALRFLPQSRDSVMELSGDTTDGDFQVKQGEYVYCYCSANSFTQDSPLAQGASVATIEIK